MPLLCISLLALLLLPQSLSCNSKRPLREVEDDYLAIVYTTLENTRQDITTLLQNSSCPELRHKPRNCTSDTVDEISTLHILVCNMMKLELSQTKKLIQDVIHSIGCPCIRPTKEPKLSATRWMVATQRPKIKINRETRRICRAKAILSAMTDCYQILYTRNKNNQN